MAGPKPRSQAATAAGPSSRQLCREKSSFSCASLNASQSLPASVTMPPGEVVKWNGMPILPRTCVLHVRFESLRDASGKFNGGVSGRTVAAPVHSTGSSASA